MFTPARFSLSAIAGLGLVVITALTASLQARQDIAAQIPDLEKLPDLSDELQKQIDANGGSLRLADRRYRITKTLEFDLVKHGMVGIRAETGSATLIMDGPGPAIRLTGSHEGSAAPDSFKPATWRERMPIIEGIVILGNHPEADGIELNQCVQPIVTQVSVRGCRHAIHLTTRNRNVTISDCQLYENEGVGIFFDDVNLHQTNISNCHISYNRGGGIVVRDGNVRNVQITGCDIEANMPGDADTPTRTANVFLDVSGSADDKTRSIAEVAITGCTIQHSANYGADEGKTVALGGANIRLAGKEVWPIDSVTISGNVISDTTTNIEIDHSMDINISGNAFFAPKPDHLVVSHSQRVSVSGNTFNPRQFERPGALRFIDSQDCVVSGTSIHAATSTDGALILENCDGFVINGVNLTDCARGIVVKSSKDVLIGNCRVARTANGAADLEVDPDCREIMLGSNQFAGKTLVPDAVLAK
ncbi:MAG: right-handed parallel beta-helix repeat-containing protein [Verrucomicrobiae bacterium]|nr:right-handed parallel beta-helix repeat-containing protein [Verrucomicrobiae bacterium]